MERVVGTINFHRTHSEDVAKKLVQERVEDAFSIAEAIYKQNPQNVKSCIIEALRPIRFLDSTGYYFATSLDGIEVLFADRPELEGNNLLNMTDSQGKFVIKDMIEIARTKGEGFYEYLWTKPNSEGSDHRKIAYIKYFEPLDMLIGSGVYIEDLEASTQREMLDIIADISFGPKDDGYIFVVRYDGVKLMNNVQRHLIGQNLWDITDPNGIKVTQEQKKAADKPGGDYITYSWQKPSTGEIAPKVSFVMGVPEWEWMIGTGVYLDEIESRIEMCEHELRQQLLKQVLFTIAITFLLIIISICIYKLLSRTLVRDINTFVEFFKKAANADIKIDVEKVRFEEMVEIAENANSMLSDNISLHKKLWEEKEQLAITLDSIGDAVLSTDIDGRVVRMNPIAQRMTGWKIEDAAGRPISEVLHLYNSETGEKAVSPVDKVLESGTVVGLANHTTLVSRDGSEYLLSDSAAPISDTEGNIVGVVLVFQDVTEQYRATETIQRIQKLESIGVLAGGIAHDFNNILTGIFGNIELGRLALSTENDVSRYLDNALLALERARHLTKQLLTFSQGGLPIFESVSLPAIIDDALEFNLTGSNVKADTDIPDELWPVRGDKGQLSHVLANLIINARESMPNGGIIKISAVNITESTMDMVRVRITDFGQGIDEANIARIFDPYFSTKKTGNGLGLAIVHSIVIRHDGWILVNSKPGKGTTFSIFLPATTFEPAKTQAVEGNKDQTTTGLRGRILIMDDEDIVAEVLSAMLQRLGFETETSPDGDTAIELFQKAVSENRPFDHVIMDMTIPGGMGGMEAANKILEINVDASLIVSSGYTTDPVMSDFEKFGFKARLVKPFQFADLQNVFREL